jgi:hypothetical protein
MAEAERSADWRELYKQAVLEPDPEKLAMRIDKAHKAIRWHISELWHVEAADTNERSQLDAASYFLGLLRTIAAKKVQPKSPQYSSFAAGKQAS